MFERERVDRTIGMHVGTVTRVESGRAWVQFKPGGREPFQYGPCLVPDAISKAETVTVTGSGETLTVTVTPRPLLVGQKVAVHIDATGGYILARYA